jgi:hypothetical protein
MNKLLSILTLTFLIASCDPPRNCTKPMCLYSDAKTDLYVTLTGNMDSVINVGDTIRLKFKLPDTLNTNYGNIVFGNMLGNSFFVIHASSGDSVIGSGEGAWVNSEAIPKQFIEFDNTSGNFNENGPGWNHQTRSFECLFIPNKKGKCVLDFSSGKVNLKANDGEEWQINTIINLTNDKRYNQYLSWMTPSMQSEALSIVSQKKGWYCFEVK